MNKYTILPFLILILILFYLVECRADGIIPVSNFFTPEIALQSTIFILAIIFFEAFLLRQFIRQVNFKTNLWRSLFLNLASSGFASLLLLFQRIKYEFIWDSYPLVLSLFLITLGTEASLMHILYIRNRLGWKRILRLTVGINILSYVMVFFLQVALIVFYIFYGSFADMLNELKWRNSSLLKNESGWIYCSVYDGGGFSLKRFDVIKEEWEPLNINFPRINLEGWDVGGDLFAYLSRKYTHPEAGDLKVLKISQGSLVMNVKGSFSQVKISPDLQKIAILERIGSAVAYRDSNSYYNLGDKCRLKIIKIPTGNIVVESSRMAINYGLCWSSDSSQVIFVSFQNEELFYPSEEDMRVDKFYTWDFRNTDQFSRHLYSLTLSNKKVQYITEGIDPELIAKSGKISFLQNGKLCQLDLASGKVEVIISNFALRRGHDISPTGTKVLTEFLRKERFKGGGYLAVVNIKDPKQRFIINKELSSSYVWVD